ncbi:hypothetical protein DFA_06468 [Cavenderia fasciculata]|uniref:MRPL25 domain-containing protein n=1 Tax=Cavenderia fasciculata TaxID=261658 RepID=F4PJ32_CACFS|nr:uncharacterized protein DFA_06468 [Cavenderia fasciculata]EGG24318.1 hypothetical protein DFA_06468 [Cavenderia fasciculata]|eukprot:XP_004362169.1 hypothetical protein DFA_06468 [Cavenderia fasciculata]
MSTLGNIIKINAEALLKHSLPQRSANGWRRPKLSSRQFNVLQKTVERGDQAVEWPIPAKEEKIIPERPSKLSLHTREAPLREKKIREAMANMPKLLADKMKAEREKKRKEKDNSIINLMDGYQPGGPYKHHYSAEVARLKKQAAIEKEKKKVDFIAAASKKKGKK